MANITLTDGDISKYNGDALIMPCDTELTFSKGYHRLTNLFETAGEDLQKELSAIGYCEIGNAIITKSYNLNVKHIIFMPYTDHTNLENKIDYLLFHQALRSCFALAQLYGIESLAISLMRHKTQKETFRSLVEVIFQENKNESMSYEEIIDIIMGIQKEQVNQNLKSIVIYK